MTSRALVLFSGGQDSTTCLAWALQRYSHVETVGFNYGQRHSVELECRATIIDRIRSLFPAWSPKLGDDHMLDLTLLGQVSDTALTQDKQIEFANNGLPNTFVPGRNLLFFTFAATIAYRRGLKVLIGGMCETDYSGYPDCRPEFIRAFEQLANLATKAGVEGGRFTVHAPLIAMSKADIVRAGIAHGVDFSTTVSCYQADEHGRACGRCDACRLRQQGFVDAGVPDPTRYR